MPLKNGRQSADLQTILIGSVIPSGTIAPFGGGTVPAGWMLCDGTAISRTTYSALFSAVNTTYGVGDGASTFNLPDARGMFLRGAGSKTIGAVTYETTRGTTQQDQMQRLTGRFTGPFVRSGSTSRLGMVSSLSGTGSDAPNNGSSGGVVINLDSASSPNARTSATDSGETRPANIGVNYIIKL